MPTLDFIRNASVDQEQNLQLSLPLIHSAALGFVPNTEISGGLVQGDDSETSEIVFSPYAPGHDVFRLEVSLRNGRGVVESLLNAIWAIGVNVIAGETVTIDGGKQHKCWHLLDWQSARRFDSMGDQRPASDNVFRPLMSRIPVEDHRYLSLYKSIQSFCADSLTYACPGARHRGGLEMPAIRMEPIQRIMAIQDERHDYTVQRTGHGKALASSRIEVKPTHLASVRQRGGWHDEDGFQYILSSDPASRTLRALIPPQEVTRRTLHMGFTHEDSPGALATIAAALAGAKFNIVQSLLRKRNEHTSSWEVLATYEGDDQQLGSGSTLEEVASIFKGQVEVPLRKHLSYYNVELRRPLFPKAKDGEGAWPLGVEERISPSRPDVPIGKMRAIRETAPKPQAESARSWAARQTFVGQVLELRESCKPRLFLSYGATGREFAEPLTDSLEANGFEVVVYQQADGRRLMDEARRRIESCDFFLGLWTQDQFKDGDTTTIFDDVSPWLPMEVGIALQALDQDYIRWALGEGLPARVARRYGSEFGQWTIPKSPRDWSETIPQVVDFCVREWHAKFDWKGLELFADDDQDGADCQAELAL